MSVSDVKGSVSITQPTRPRSCHRSGVIVPLFIVMMGPPHLHNLPYILSPSYLKSIEEES